MENKSLCRDLRVSIAKTFLISHFHTKAGVQALFHVFSHSSAYLLSFKAPQQRKSEKKNTKECNFHELLHSFRPETASLVSIVKIKRKENEIVRFPISDNNNFHSVHFVPKFRLLLNSKLFSSGRVSEM
jgi:hypothetical protein